MHMPCILRLDVVRARVVTAIGLKLQVFFRSCCRPSKGNTVQPLPLPHVALSLPYLDSHTLLRRRLFLPPRFISWERIADFCLFVANGPAVPLFARAEDGDAPSSRRSWTALLSADWMRMLLALRIREGLRASMRFVSLTCNCFLWFAFNVAALHSRSQLKYFLNEG